MFGGRRNSKSDEGKELHHSNSHGRSQSSRSRNESPPRDRDRNQRDHHDETPHRPQQPQRDTSEERRHERQRIELEHLERHRKEQEQKRKDAEREELAKKKELERKKWEREEAERKRKLAELEWKAKTALAKRLYVLLDAHCDYSAQPEVRFKAGEGQRFFNAATRACLSSMMKDSDIPTIGPADIALPGQTGEKEQVSFDVLNDNIVAEIVRSGSCQSPRTIFPRKTERTDKTCQMPMFLIPSSILHSLVSATHTGSTSKKPPPSKTLERSRWQLMIPPMVCRRLSHWEYHQPSIQLHQLLPLKIPHPSNQPPHRS